MADVSAKSDTARREEEVLAFWKEHRTFEKSLKKRAPKGEYVFYDGPPFATGLPHYGHIVASVMKDAIPRFFTMRGYRVPRVWGWDTHGLPIENIVEKELGFTHKKDIEAYGIEKFNEQCRAQVLEYVDEWKKIIPRIGRWVDMDTPYTTMDASFMESVWWVFKQIYSKGLVYEDYRSMHICPRCETTLSQQEVAEGYKDVKDIAVTVKFKVTNPEKLDLTGDVYLLAWTTTPWTLPGNVALAVGGDVRYRIAAYGYGEHQGTFIYARDAQEKLFGEADFDELGIRKGADLVGLEYEPPFPYYKRDTKLPRRENGWKVYTADFVTTDAGTGIVHIAPAFGEDDMALGKAKGLPFVQHVNYDGTIRPEVTDFAGREVKPRSDDDKVRLATDIDIIRYLQEHETFFAKENLVHSYPHCWRCDTPLLNYATRSWFVGVAKIKEALLRSAKHITWAPAHIKEGRFGKWLEGARDWSISRQRFWASVIPIWKDSKGGLTVIGSVEEFTRHTKKSGNTYLLMRHSESEGNVKEVLDSDGIATNGLTDKGRTQARAAGEALKGRGVTKIYASPFLRTKETAQIVAKVIGFPEQEIIYDDRLRELNFGSLNGKHQGTSWDFCEEHGYAAPMPNGGESHLDAKRRFGEFLYEIERTLANEEVLIISHGIAFESLLPVITGAATDASYELLKNLRSVPHAQAQELEFTPLPHNSDYELDLHLPYVDQVSLVNDAGEPMVRVSDVLDTWFDSGSMPYAQVHYPFEHKDRFEKTFPAQFIAEGVDQTRAWFYYLHVLAGALFGMHAFEHVIVNGIVVSPEDGKKLSKSKKNYPDPMLMVDTYGADALRFYLLSSPVVQAENLAFSEEGVDEVAKKNVGRFANVLSFYELFKDGTAASTDSPHVLDRWMLARLNELILETTNGYEHYELDRAVRPLTLFIDDLSAWYVRRSRERIKEKGHDKTAALATLRYVLRESAKVMAPAMPFLAEEVYKAVREESDPESVHLCDWPRVRTRNLFTQLFMKNPDVSLIADMARTRVLASEVLRLRQKAGIKVRQPLATVSIPDPLPEALSAILADELNVKTVDIGKELALDTELTAALIKEGDEREFSSAIAQARKTEGLAPEDVVSVERASDGTHVATLSTGDVRFNLVR